MSPSLPSLLRGSGCSVRNPLEQTKSGCPEAVAGRVCEEHAATAAPQEENKREKQNTGFARQDCSLTLPSHCPPLSFFYAPGRRHPPWTTTMPAGKLVAIKKIRLEVRLAVAPWPVLTHCAQAHRPCPVSSSRAASSKTRACRGEAARRPGQAVRSGGPLPVRNLALTARPHCCPTCSVAIREISVLRELNHRNIVR